MPTDTESRFRAGVALHREGDWQRAADAYAAVLASEPAHAGALSMSGALALQAGQPETAIEILTRAAEIAPADPAIHFHLGLATQQLGSNELARQCYETAITLRPDYREAIENLAVVLGDLGDTQGALAASERVLAMTPDSELALANAGTFALNLGRDADALRYFDRSLALYPFNANVHLKRSQVLLRDERFGEAWDAYAWRFVASDYLAANAPVTAHFPHWAGQSIARDHVVVTAEQGIGDEIMFASCLADLARLAGHVTLQCNAKLKPLFARSFPAVDIVDHDVVVDELAADYRVAAGSLPRYFRRDSAGFATAGAYLVADQERVAHWLKWLASQPASSSIGIAWSGGLDPRAREARSVAAAALVGALEHNDATIVALQYGDASAELDALPTSLRERVRVPPGLDPWADVDDLAALIVALDRVVTVDNAIAHLGGALGVPTDVLLPVSAERRWLRDRATSPWYRSLRLWRQASDRPGHWAPVLDALGASAQAASRGSLTPATTQAPRPPRLADARARVVLLNDTASGYHWGCTLTVNGLVSELRRRGCAVDSVRLGELPPVPDMASLAREPSSIEAAACSRWLAMAPTIRERIAVADCVVVNGEGTLHGCGAQATSLLYATRAIQCEFDKPVAIVNHSGYPPVGASDVDRFACAWYRQVYTDAADVAVREPASLRALADLGVEARLTFDCLPLALPHIDRARPGPVLLAGSAAANAGIAEVMARFVAAATARGHDCEYLYGANGTPAEDDHRLGADIVRRTGGRLRVRHAATEQEWLTAIAGAPLLVSGRFHHTIAAACLGTPFAVAGSNTSKIAGLLESLGQSAAFVAWDALSSDAGVDRLLAMAEQGAGGRVEPGRLAALKDEGSANVDGIERLLPALPDRPEPG